MALNTDQLKQEILEMYDELQKYDNSPGKKADDAKEFMAEELSKIITKFVKTGKVDDDGNII